MLSVTFFLASVMVLIYVYFKNKRANDLADQFPGPSSIPILGNIFNFTVSSTKEAGQLFEESYQKYGEIYRFKIFHKIFFVICDPKVYEVILSSTSKYLAKNANYKFIAPWLGEGLGLSTGKRWHQHRKIITPAFHFKILEQYIEVFDRQSDTLVQKLQHECHKGIVDILPFVTLMTLDIICETAMGTRIDVQNHSETNYVKAVNEVTGALSLRFTSMWRRSDLLFNLFAQKDKKKIDNVIETLHNFTNKVIVQRRGHLLKNNGNVSEKCNENIDYGMTKKMAFLDILLQSTIDGVPLSNTEIREEVDTFLFAGHDTTTAAITFTLYLISRHPEVQSKLTEEIKQVIGTDPLEPVTYSHLHELKYMDLVLKESFRLLPIGPIIGRFIEEDIVLDDGRIIPANSNVLLQFYMTFRNPKYFKDPEKFVPERFSLENMAESKIHPFAYTPFSAGPRNCIGPKYGLLETKAVVSKVLRHFELLPKGEKPHNINED